MVSKGIDYGWHRINRSNVSKPLPAWTFFLSELKMDSNGFKFEMDSLKREWFTRFTQSTNALKATLLFGYATVVVLLLMGLVSLLNWGFFYLISKLLQTTLSRSAKSDPYAKGVAFASSKSDPYAKIAQIVRFKKNPIRDIVLHTYLLTVGFFRGYFYPS